jgi:hypothetical protein
MSSRAMNSALQNRHLTVPVFLVKYAKAGYVSWHSARPLGKTVPGTDFGDRMGRGSGQFAESALDTLCAARNRG